MRFALIATTAAAAVAIPLAVAAAGPQMSRNEFVSAVRCAAYEDVSGAQNDQTKYELNAEGLHQSVETRAAAAAEVRAIARQAVNSQTQADQAMLHSQWAAACSSAFQASGGGQADAV